MQIHSNYQLTDKKSQTSFKSKFIPTEALLNALDPTKTAHNCYELTNRNFVKAMNALLDDRKKDILSVVQTKETAKLYVNHEFFSQRTFSVSAAKALIIDYAKQKLGIIPAQGYDNLTIQEVVEMKHSIRPYFCKMENDPQAKVDLSEIYRAIELGINNLAEENMHAIKVRIIKTWKNMTKSNHLS